MAHARCELPPDPPYGVKVAAYAAFRVRWCTEMGWCEDARRGAYVVVRALGREGPLERVPLAGAAIHPTLRGEGSAWLRVPLLPCFRVMGRGGVAFVAGWNDDGALERG